MRYSNIVGIGRTAIDDGGSKACFSYCRTQAVIAQVGRIQLHGAYVANLRDYARRLEALGTMRQQESNRLENASELITKRLSAHIEFLGPECN